MTEHNTEIDGMALIRAERRRQVEIEGWTPEHDRQHGRDVLYRAASAYRYDEPSSWPWDMTWWKPKDHLSNLIRAGALYMAANEAAGFDPESGTVIGAVADEVDGILTTARRLLSTPVQPAGGEQP